MQKTVLVSGAGVAGTTVAWWLARAGFAVTVVERADAARSSGNPVDVRGAALEAVTAMGITDRLRAVATRVRELVFVDDVGRIIGRVANGTSANGGDIELPRGDLARVLREASFDSAEYLFGDQISRLTETETSVEVRFDSGSERRYDLVVGADGLHSRVRRLAFGPESDFVRYMGLYVATAPLLAEQADPWEVLLYNAPGRAISIHPAAGRGLCAFIFRHRQVADFDHRDPEQHRRILTRAYSHVGWRTQELIDAATSAEELYFDAVSRVTLPSWSRGRITLVGDAASCLSLFGDGSSLAIAGARMLAEELAQTSDHQTALRRYERRQRQAVMPRQRGAWLAAAQIVPRTRIGLLARNASIRLVSAAGRSGRSKRGKLRDDSRKR